MHRLTPWVPRLALPLALLAAAGCAVVARPNRRLLNALDRGVQPESRVLRLAGAPLAVPVATGALLADALVVHPAVSAAPAATDTREILWAGRRPGEFQDILAAPLRVAATPFVFVGIWALRCAAPVDERPKR